MVWFFPKKRDPEEAWALVVEKAYRAIVQIRSLVAKDFEGHSAGSSLATGFVVDKRLGLILSNAHVVTTAPMTCQGVFKNDEEIDIQQLYVDPIHDFGFFRYNPMDVKFMNVEELLLNPSGARKDVQIRVVGSDAGEKMMVLRGTLSRTDRNPPECKSHT